MSAYCFLPSAFCLLLSAFCLLLSAFCSFILHPCFRLAFPLPGLFLFPLSQSYLGFFRLRPWPGTQLPKVISDLKRKSRISGMDIAQLRAIPDGVSYFQSCGCDMDTEERLLLQRQALEAIKQSTKTLEVADQLLRVGNKTEAQRLRDEARDQRNSSLQLMAKAGRRSV